jgi:hypothetical protein
VNTDDASFHAFYCSVTQRVPSNEMKENQKPHILKKQNSGGGEDHAAGHVLNDRPKIKTLQSNTLSNVSLSRDYLLKRKRD